MAPKRKGKANKLARMSEEERMRYLQHRAAMEEEVQRRKQELITTYLKTKLKHEETFTRLNSAKINQQWRHLLRQIKCKELKEDVEAIRERFEVILLCKNKIIQNLLVNFDQAEFQHSSQFKSHSETISKLLEVHKIRLDDLYDWYSHQLQEILARSETNKDKILMEMRDDFDEMKTTQLRFIGESKSNLNGIKTKLEFMKNEQETTVLITNIFIIIKLIQLLLKMIKLEEKYAKEIETMRQKCNLILKDYHNNTETKRAHYRILSEQDDSNSLQIIRHFEEIAHYSSRVENANIALDEMKENNRKEIEKINDEKENVRNELLQMQRQCTQNSAVDREQLKFMIHVSNKVIQELNDVFQRGEKLQRIADNCRKLQQLRVQSNNEFETEQEAHRGSTPYKQLQQFWKAYNRIKIRHEMLQTQQQSALEENKKLQKTLKLYMASVRRSFSVPRKCGF